MAVTFDGTSNCGLTSRVGAQSIYPVDQLGIDGINGIAQLGGPAPSVATFAATNWSLPNSTLVANEFALMEYGQTVSSFSSPSPGSPTFVQVQQFITNGSPTFATLSAFTGANTQGNRIAVMICWSLGGAAAFLSGVTDTAGNVYDQVGATLNPGAALLFYAYFECRSCLAAAANTNAITVQWQTGVQSPTVQALEYSGCNPYASAYGITTANATTSTGPAEVALTATSTGDMLICMAVVITSATAIVGPITGNTQRGSTSVGGVGFEFAGTELAAPNTSANDVGVTLNTASTWYVLGVILPQAVSILPIAPPTGGDSFFIQPNQAQTGVTISGSWTIALAALVSGGTSPTGNANFNVQIWWSPDGVNFTWAGTASLSNINLATTTQQNTTATISLGNRYFSGGSYYYQVALEVQSGAAPAGCTVALVQDGSNSVITTAAFNWAPPSQNHTFCCFVWSGSLSQGGGTNGAIWSLGLAGGPLLAMGGGSPGSWELFIGPAPDQVSVTSGAIVTSKSWYFVAMTQVVTAGSIVGTLYYKRLGAPTCSVLATSALAGLASTPGQMLFGTGVTGTSFGLAATVAGARIWTGQLTQAEIEAESNSLNPVRTADLFESWPFVSDVDYVGRVQSIPLSVAGLASSQTPFSGPLLAKQHPKQALRGRV